MPVNNSKILSWNRLEPRPRTEDFDRTLRAEIRDPLWMMTRQWQFGEFQGEDAGSALFSRIHIKTSRINMVKLGNEPARNISNHLPLETDAEKERIEEDFLMRLEMGRYWEKLLIHKIKAQSNDDPQTTQLYIDSVIAQFRSTNVPVDLNFYLPNQGIENANFYSNTSLWQTMSTVINGKAIDGKILLDWLKDGNNAIEFLNQGNINISNDIISDAAFEFINWYERNYAQPENQESAWNANQMEYKFGMSFPNSETGGSDVLIADEYYQGKLDWFAFDFDKTPNAYPDLIEFDQNQIEESKFTLIPTTISFAGMPHPRWWQMEDSRVDLGDINPSTTDTAKLIYSEFGLIYSNDWMIFPYTVKAGSLCEVKDIIVTDCFGQRTKVVSANVGIDDDWKRWSFFGLSTKGDDVSEADTRLYIPSAINTYLEGNPIEAINFIRDEMANMVWAIEKTIPNGMGEGTDAFEAGLRYVNYLKANTLPVAPSANISNDAEIKYKIANTVPENWIPFVPVKTGNTVLSREIQLRRAAMPRQIDGLPIERIRPKSLLLQENAINIGEPNETWNAYYIHEEEVPRSGVIVKRNWQRTRTENGDVIVWLGRRKTTGRGEGSSNLAFDILEDI